MTAEEILRQFGQQINQRLDLDATGKCRFFLDSELELEIELTQLAGQRLSMTCPIGQVPDCDQESMFTSLLQANLDLRSTGAGVFAVDSMNRVILQQTLIIADTRYHDFTEALNVLLTHAKSWKARLAIAKPGTLRTQ